MATASVLSPLAIPGLGSIPTLDDLEISRRAYNSLNDDKDQPQVELAILEELNGLLVQHGVYQKFGFHLVHGHLTVPPGQLMFGKTMAALPGCWTRPTDITQLNRQSIHGHIFTLNDKHEFIAYEYRDGAGSQITATDTEFIVAVQQYLISHNLENLLGIEVLEGDPNAKLQEFVLSNSDGTVMLDANITKVSETYRVTGWAAAINETTGIVELKGGQSHAKTTKGTHQVFYDGKGLPHMPDDKEAGIQNALRAEGVIE